MTSRGFPSRGLPSLKKFFDFFKNYDIIYLEKRKELKNEDYLCLY